MTKFLFLILACASLAAQAQTNVYHPFPDSNAVWYQSGASGFYICLYGPTQVNYSYEMRGDTLISNKVYHKMFIPCMQGNDSCYLICGQKHLPGYAGCIRQEVENKKVFYVPDGNSVERLLYDFNLQVGDTVTDYCKTQFNSYTVYSIDSILIGSSYRKRWHFYGENYQLIEGIGGTWDVLKNPCPTINIDDCQYYLACFTQDGIQQYQSPTFNFCSITCNILTTAINSKENKITVSISPDPFNTTTVLNIADAHFTTCTLNIYDLSGRMVHRETISELSTIISRNAMTSGIYFYQVHTANGITANGKFVVE